MIDSGSANTHINPLKKILACIYVDALTGSSTLRELLSMLGDVGKQLLSQAIKTGLVEEKEGSLSITRAGRRLLRVGLTGGVFDIIHVGHVATLSKAKSMCDVLVVIIARDKTVEKLKGKRPINDEKRRKAVIAALKPVDATILGDERDFMKPVRAVYPDVVFLGYDQTLLPDLERALTVMGVEVVKLDIKVEGVSTSSIQEKLLGGITKRGRLRH